MAWKEGPEVGCHATGKVPVHEGVCRSQEPCADGDGRQQPFIYEKGAVHRGGVCCKVVMRRAQQEGRERSDPGRQAFRFYGTRTRGERRITAGSGGRLDGVVQALCWASRIVRSTGATMNGTGAGWVSAGVP